MSQGNVTWLLACMSVARIMPHCHDPGLEQLCVAGTYHHKKLQQVMKENCKISTIFFFLGGLPTQAYHGETIKGPLAR